MIIGLWLFNILEIVEGVDLVKIVTNTSSTPPQAEEPFSSSQEVDNKASEEQNGGTNRIQIEDNDHYRTAYRIPMDTEPSERVHQRIDQEYSDEEADGASYMPTSSANVASLSISNEPSNFMVNISILFRSLKL